MKIFTYSDARQKFSSVLESAQQEGKVLVRRRDGRLFSIRPEKSSESPFDVRGVKSSVTTKEIVETLREVRAEPVAGGDAAKV
jgi:antitoxin Phd